VARHIAGGPRRRRARLMPRAVTVVGGGLFGVTAACALARAGCQVTLVERASGLLRGASGVNQYRLHRGFHYPRSPETVAACLAAEESFRRTFHDAVIDDHAHYYAVARAGSRLSAADYLAALSRMGLTWRIERPPVVRAETVACCIRVDEAAVDLTRLRRTCARLLCEAGVQVRTGTVFRWCDLPPGETVVLATYAANNQLLRAAGLPATPYRYQLAELLSVKLPPTYDGISCLVMDGDFPSLDPCGRTGHHVVGHVTEMHHVEETRMVCTFEAEAARRRSSAATWRRWLATGTEFYAGLDGARLLGSQLVVRTTLAGVSATDARPTLVKQHDERVFTVFSGKLTTCTTAAQTVTALVLGV
ncbi:NAD(P)/FAD-dependent oxidoreductase, partial [Micromonospora sp. CPCC 206061]|uniref:NAD(P)/FAD-dependent oxidoreductase n=1 Tax=Micromonospora sp. CPCC 206061 TaxID=3122410 RepID=UPI002FF172FC